MKLDELFQETPASKEIIKAIISGTNKQKSILLQKLFKTK